MGRQHTMKRLGSRRETGSAAVVISGLVLICAAISMAVIVPNLSRHREAQAHLDRQRAFHLAESGVDWAIAEIRKSGGTVPTGTSKTRFPGNGTSGSYTVTFSAWTEGEDADDGGGDDETSDAVVVVVDDKSKDDDRSGKSKSKDDDSGSGKSKSKDDDSGKSKDDSSGKSKDDSSGKSKDDNSGKSKDDDKSGKSKSYFFYAPPSDGKSKDDDSGKSKDDDSGKSKDDDSGKSKDDDSCGKSKSNDDDASGISFDDDVSGVAVIVPVVTSTDDSSGSSSTVTYEILSTGEINGHRQTIRVLARRAVTMPKFGGALHLNVDAPIVDLKGNSFFVSGLDHDLEGNVDAFGVSQYGLTSPAAADVIKSQIDSKNYDQIEGLGSAPSVGRIDKMDLDAMADEAKRTATDLISSGTHANLTLGSPGNGNGVVAYCAGDLHTSGQMSGYGTLVVDGDLKSSGKFLWTGLVMVRGRASFSGGGSGNRVIGAVIIGEEIANTTVVVTEDDVSDRSEDDDSSGKSKSKDDDSSGKSKSKDDDSSGKSKAYYYYAPPGKSGDDDSSGKSTSKDDDSGSGKSKDDDSSGKSKSSCDDDSKSEKSKDDDDTSEEKTDSNVTLTGTIDILYSSKAIGLTAKRLGLTTLLSWQIVANPKK